MVLRVPAQPPVEAPAGGNQTMPVQASPSLPEVGLNPFDQLAELVAQNPIAVLLIILGALILILLIVFFLSKGAMTHQYVKRMRDWLENPAIDAFVLALDPAINVAKLIPAKRVGSILTGLEEPAFIIPIQGGETYTFEGVGRPLVVAVKYSKFGVQWLPGLEQLVSLSVLPVAADARQSEPQDTAELLERLVKNIQTQTATISGELFIGPDLKIYVSTKTPTALNLLAREISYAARKQ